MGLSYMLQYIWENNNIWFNPNKNAQKIYDIDILKRKYLSY